MRVRFPRWFLLHDNKKRPKLSEFLIWLTFMQKDKLPEPLLM
ncbi:hypothetical protein LRHMDP2_2340 [Lacticaseibacillus rhamnosus LRHMDP2]|uniref:Uncharacterized protein n=1 Tax=Lacticaseibacillus rhamnosus LRHMDP3 TaxID=1203259 RepID=A0AB33XTC0_LACRH|nr:hypothetical protein LRHMDP2_2340 [Lacticaseibacillus rhamnosus LRHMDP2]EKS50120.1 hypothetical protein LRHMDP3_1944 [Lacticaseibacillus rhamnosus LRHMDP3]